MRTILAALVAVLALSATAQANTVTSLSNLIGSGRYETQDVSLQMFANVTPGQPVPITWTSYNEPGTMPWARVDLQSTTKEKVTLNWTPGATAVGVQKSATLHVPSGGSGWDELRWHGEFAAGSGAERRFHTTRNCVHYPTGTGNYCGGPTTRGRCGGGSWYTTALYNVAFIDCRDLAAILAGNPPANIRVKFQVDYTSGYGLIARDPDGQQQISGHYPANTWITIPNPGAGAWLLSVASNGQDGGYQIG